MTIELRVKRGDTFALQCTYRGDAGERADLTGVTAVFSARASGGSAEPWGGSSATGEIDLQGVAGVLDIRIEAAVMAAVEPGAYSAEIELRYPDGTVDSSDTFGVWVLEDLIV